MNALFPRTLVYASLMLGLAACAASTEKAPDTEDPARGGNGGTRNAGAGGAGGATGTPGAGGATGTAGTGGTVNGGAPGMAGAGGPSPASPATCAPPNLKLTRIAQLDSPMALTQGGADDFLLVAERAGRIRVVKNGMPAGTFMDLQSSVDTEAFDDANTERGLQNLALHPAYADNGRFFVFYTRRSKDPFSEGAQGDIVIAEGQRSEDPTKAKAGLTPLLVIPHGDDHHIGGMLAFGPDGFLYAATGDGGGGDQRGKRSWDLTDLRSKILRIDVDDVARRVPGNMTRDNAKPQVWANGTRNPFRGSFDRVTGDLYFGDVGDASYEEVNFVPPGKTNLNFGWGFDKSKVEGPHQVQTGMEGRHPMPYYTAVAWTERDELPILEYPHDGPGWQVAASSWQMKGFACLGAIDDAEGCARAVIGGYVYRGQAIGQLSGRYFYGDHVRNEIRSFVVKDGALTCPHDHTSELVTPSTRLQGLTGFGEDKAGELYALDLVGNVYRIDPR